MKRKRRKRTSAATSTGDPWLFTPGPLTTSATVKRAMLHDLGSRDDAFIELTRRVRDRLTRLAGGSRTHSCIPLQGSGTFAVEAMIGTLLPPEGHLLNLVNGAYGRRITRICEMLGRRVSVLESPEDRPVEVELVKRALAGEGSITHVSIVHCETTSGVLNPVAKVAECTARYRQSLLVDAMSTFGALPVDVRRWPATAIAASSNKCLEGTPGIAFVIAEKTAIERSAGNAHSLSLDLHAQWQALEDNGQWRFTPPVQTLLALDEALDELQKEGGVAGRGRRYKENCKILIDGMRKMGFTTFLDAAHQAPIIVTFHVPEKRGFNFRRFYEGLRKRGYIIYPGKLTAGETFRIGCIGRITPVQVRGLLAAVGELL